MLSKFLAFVFGFFKSAPKADEVVPHIELKPTPTAPKPVTSTARPVAPAPIPEPAPTTSLALTWLGFAKPITEFFETCILKAYPDPASPMAVALVAAGLWQKVLAGGFQAIPQQYLHLSAHPWTAGWGSTGADIIETTVLTQAQADAKLILALNEAADNVDRLVKVFLTPYQKGALVDFLYNEGVGHFQTSTLLKVLNTGDYASAAEQFAEWNLAGGKVNADLVKRRGAEKSLFLTEEWSK